MLAITDRSTATCLVIEVSGAVEGAKYEAFTRVEERIFPEAELDAAIAWASGS